jgi:hypothetical protein
MSVHEHAKDREYQGDEIADRIGPGGADPASYR